MITQKKICESTADEQAEFNTDLDEAYRSGIHDAIYAAIDLVNADKL